MPRADLESRLGRDLLLFDGAMGTSIQFAAPPAEAFAGHEGLNEWLTLTRPDLIREIHAGFLEAGSDLIETNTFGAFSVVLDEYGVGGAARELAHAAAALARRVADEYATPSRPRWVAGSMGPGTRLASLGQISWAALAAAYEPLVEELVAGGVDLLLIETVQDPLQAKAALEACRRVLARTGRRLPVGVQVTVETAGTLLLGTEATAALAAVAPYRPAFFGLNCATGPAAMRPQLLQLAGASPFPLSVQPNAGLPRAEGGRMVYDLTPERFAAELRDFVEHAGVSIAGGCCGTTHEHLAALAQALRGRGPAPRAPRPQEAAASLYSAVPLQQQPAPLLIGERTNANGSRQFRRLLEAGDWEGMVAMAQEQAAEGAHLLDVCVACVGRDERADMDEYCRRLATAATLPLMIDSTEAPVIAAALERLGGRAVVNSINLEDGEGRARAVLELCRIHGAAVVGLCIDEEGMARAPEHKLQVARRLLHLAGEHGLAPGDLLLDPLTFTLATGDPDDRHSALATLEGLRLIKRELPGVRTSLGVSNISFGLKPALRQILNSVFLQRALDAGLDAAILHAGRLLPLHQIAAPLQDMCHRLIDGDHRRGDPLAELLAAGGGESARRPAAARDERPLEERLQARIVDGRGEGMEAELDEALAGRPPWELINEVLLAGMRTVGELFAAGRLQLPFVLKSAETMKRAVRHLEPLLGGAGGPARGRLLLATVRGDVHDIGKNLVDIIVRNNGWDVENLGIKVPVEGLLEAIRRQPPDAVGLSGLLVRSVFVMRENLEVFAREGITLPVILGGAALNRRHVEEELRPLYPGPLHYARDAFEGLQLLESIRAARAGTAPLPLPPGDAAASPDGEEATALVPLRPAVPAALDPRLDTAPADSRPALLAELPTPPFWGARLVPELPLAEVWPWLNLNTLTRGEWGFRRGRLDAEAWQRIEMETIRPLLARLQADAEARHWLRPALCYGWFPAQAEGRRLWIWRHPDERDPAWHLDFPRQGEAPWRCISDFFAPLGSPRRDVLGVQWVTVGAEATAEAKRHLEADRYQEYLYRHGLSVEAAEALAEAWHRRMREELGIAGEDSPRLAGIFRQGYRGSRYSFGYPACPRLEDQRLLADILGVDRIGCRLTEEWQIVPEQSTSAVIVHHPEARYFSV
ncbi:MAG: methionine synthase [bacterium]|nr:methionine synthase [bacterium]